MAVNKPSGSGKIRKPTDRNQIHLDSINPPVVPDFAPVEFDKVKPGPRVQNTMRVGK
jgi:hypothetical protein